MDMAVLGYEWFQLTGMILIPFFLITVFTSPLFRRPSLMRYHIMLSRYTILIGLMHMFFALSALLFGFFP